MAPAFLAGFALGLSLIVAIGAQNAFLLRQGLKREHVLSLVLVFALSDAALIALGVAGLGTLIEGNHRLLVAATLGGALFLLAYAAMALRRALRGAGALSVSESQATTLSKALAMALAFTFLNPHVYLDTVVLVGSVSASFSGPSRAVFGTGAALASVLWFAALGYGARLLAPVFARPIAWVVLDLIIAAVMATLAIGLLGALF